VSIRTDAHAGMGWPFTCGSGFFGEGYKLNARRMSNLRPLTMRIANWNNASVTKCVALKT
jgi:hypothetical protein